MGLNNDSSEMSSEQYFSGEHDRLGRKGGETAFNDKMSKAIHAGKDGKEEAALRRDDMAKQSKGGEMRDVLGENEV